MDTKQQALEYIKQLGSSRTLSREEVTDAYDEGALGTKADPGWSHRVGVSGILSYIGGAIVFLGISILVYQNWDALDSVGRVVATLGSAIAAYAIATIFGKYQKFTLVSSAFYLISALVGPIGLYTLADALKLDLSSQLIQNCITGSLFLAYLISFLALRRYIFSFFSVVFGTWFYFTLTTALFTPAAYAAFPHLPEYQILIAALTYITLGYALRDTKQSSLTSFLYVFGAIAFYGAALALGGWKPTQNLFWELAFPVLVFTGLFGSTSLRSNGLLGISTIFLMVYIMKITGEYFRDGLGWSLALVLSGLLLIAVGYFYVYLKKRFMKIAV
jgi:hypothetical protein